MNRVWRSTTGLSMNWWLPASSRGFACIIGTCRRLWRMLAGGRTEIRRHGLPAIQRSSLPASVIASSASRPSMSRRSSICSHSLGKRDRSSEDRLHRATHHVNLAHGAAVDALRETVPGVSIGCIHNFQPCWPSSGSAADPAAAERLGTYGTGLSPIHNVSASIHPWCGQLSNRTSGLATWRTFVCALTNNSWVIDAAGLRAACGFSAVRLTNDFEAVTWSLPILSRDKLLQVSAGSRSSARLSQRLVPAQALEWRSPYRTLPVTSCFRARVAIRPWPAVRRGRTQ